MRSVVELTPVSAFVELSTMSTGRTHAARTVVGKGGDVPAEERARLRSNVDGIMSGPVLSWTRADNSLEAGESRFAR